MKRREFVALGGALAAVVPPAIGAWDSEGQQRRRQEIYRLHQQSVGPLYDSDGRWISKEKGPSRREYLWSALSFLANEATRAKGNAVIRQMLRFKYTPDHFVGMATVQILSKSPQFLDQQTKGLLMDFLVRTLGEAGEVPIRYHGANDNFQAMDTEFAVLGAQLADHAKARHRGRAALENLAELFERRGLLSEYTSPPLAGLPRRVRGALPPNADGALSNLWRARLDDFASLCVRTGAEATHRQWFAAFRADFDRVLRERHLPSQARDRDDRVCEARRVPGAREQ